MKEIKLKINGMMCEGCENRVKSAVSLIEGVEKVEADHNTGIVIVTSKEDIDISKIKEKIKTATDLDVKEVNITVKKVAPKEEQQEA